MHMISIPQDSKAREILQNWKTKILLIWLKEGIKNPNFELMWLCMAKIQKMSPTSKISRQHPQIVTNITVATLSWSTKKMISMLANAISWNLMNILLFHILIQTNLRLKLNLANPRMSGVFETSNFHARNPYISNG